MKKYIFGQLLVLFALVGCSDASTDPLAGKNWDVANMGPDMYATTIRDFASYNHPVIVRSVETLPENVRWDLLKGSTVVMWYGFGSVYSINLEATSIRGYGDNNPYSVAWVLVTYDEMDGGNGGQVGGDWGDGYWGSPPSSNPTPDPEAAEDDDEAALPDCNSPQNAMVQAWCNGNTPTQAQRNLIDAALARMRAKGGVCVDLANIVDALLVDGTLHIYNRTSGVPGGFAPRAVDGSQLSGSDAYMGLELNWFTNYYDAVHADGSNRTLQHSLAHEADHLKGEDHLPNQTHPFETTNSRQCSDVP